jgi:hypothetical protein
VGAARCVAGAAIRAATAASAATIATKSIGRIIEQATPFVL